MVTIVARGNRHQHEPLLDDMFRHRYRMLVDRLGWKIPGIRPGYDRDAFDTDNAIYLIETHPKTGEAIASVRFLPTTVPHLMSEVFADQCDFGGVPIAADIWEASRVVYDSDRMAGDLFKRTRGLMGVAITEFAIRAGIRNLTWVTYKELYASLISFWPTRPLGLPRYYPEDKADYVAAISQMNSEALDGMRRRRGSDALVFPQALPRYLNVPAFTALERAS